MREPPLINLSHGQVLWTLSRGTLPDSRLVDQVRYLRLLGVPFRKAELGKGRGNRLLYRYEHLIELGVGVWALERGMKPQEVAKFLIGQRKSLRQLYAKAFLEQPEQAISRRRMGQEPRTFCASSWQRNFLAPPRSLLDRARQNRTRSAG